MTTKQQYEIAIDEYEVADAAFQRLLEYVESGEFMAEVLQRSVGNVSAAQQLWIGMWEKLKILKEERNIKLKTAKDSLRQAVVLGPSQERGPDGKTTVIKCGEFTVSSTTQRTFDAKSLLSLSADSGVMNDLLATTAPNKAGVDEPIVRQEWVVNYEKVYDWLRARNLQTIINGSYAEIEKTPTVKGPKEVAFLGEKKE